MAEAKRKATRREEAETDYAFLLAAFDADMVVRAAREGRVPEEWEAVWRSRGARRTKVSLWVDEDVVRFFRSMGPGYGPRMNRVLRAFLLARIAGFVNGPALPEHWREPWMDRAPGPDEVTLPRETVEGVMRAIELITAANERALDGG